MKGGLSVAVSLIAVEGADLFEIVFIVFIVDRKRHTQQQRRFHDSCFVAGNAGLCSHLEKRPLGRGKRLVEKQPWCLKGVEECIERAPARQRRVGGAWLLG
jgi:hypothetical protein